MNFRDVVGAVRIAPSPSTGREEKTALSRKLLADRAPHLVNNFHSHVSTAHRHCQCAQLLWQSVLLLLPIDNDELEFSPIDN